MHEQWGGEERLFIVGIEQHRRVLVYGSIVVGQELATYAVVVFDDGSVAIARHADSQPIGWESSRLAEISQVLGYTHWTLVVGGPAHQYYFGPVRKSTVYTSVDDAIRASLDLPF